MLTYLAVPYTNRCHSEIEDMEHRRFEAINIAASYLIRSSAIKYPVFSPISMTHPIVTHCEKMKNQESGWEFWKEADLTYLRMSSLMIVLTLGGWADSVGVQSELETAEHLGIPIYLLDPAMVGIKYYYPYEYGGSNVELFNVDAQLSRFSLDQYSSIRRTIKQKHE